jgi:hypothetical protein
MRSGTGQAIEGRLQSSLSPLTAGHRPSGRRKPDMPLAGAASPRPSAPRPPARRPVRRHAHPWPGSKLPRQADQAEARDVPVIPQLRRGRTDRDRLHRGGDRDANSALRRIALVRMHCHQPTKDHVARRTAEGRT